MPVDPLDRRTGSSSDGTSYHFCSAGCRSKFAADPERYLADKPAATTPPAKPGAIYTCPMHPEVRQVGPGACPICGMALEPEDATAETGPNPELADMTRRFWIAVALAVPVVLLENGMHLLGPPLQRAGSAGTQCLAAAAARHARWCSGPAGRSSSAAGRRWSAATSTCSR